MKKVRKSKLKGDTGANLGFEVNSWASADTLLHKNDYSFKSNGQTLERL